MNNLLKAQDNPRLVLHLVAAFLSFRPPFPNDELKPFSGWQCVGVFDKRPNKSAQPTDTKVCIINQSVCLLLPHTLSYILIYPLICFILCVTFFAC